MDVFKNVPSDQSVSVHQAMECGIIGVCVAALLWRLAAPKTPFHVYITVWLSWSFALALVALVPLDLNLVYLERCLSHFGNNTRASAVACPLEHWCPLPLRHHLKAHVQIRAT